MSLLREKAASALSLAEYDVLFARLVAEKRTSAPVSTPDLVEYTRLNWARWQRVTRTMQLLPEVAQAMTEAPPQVWLVLSEPWCGDAAQSVPVLAAMAQAAPAVELRLVLRDAHLDLMDRYLTAGGRSIPKLVAFQPDSGAERFTWGPRPREAQQLVLRLREQFPGDLRTASEVLHKWYFEDGTRSTQREVLQAMQAGK